MSKTYSALPTLKLTPNAFYKSPPPALPAMVHLEDSASASMLDFRQFRLPTISMEGSVNEALTEMKACATRLLLVTDEANHLLGIVGSEDLLGEKPLRLLRDRAMKRTDLKVSMLMTSHAHLQAVDLAELAHAKVGDIVETLLETQQHYLLVAEQTEAGAQTICGLFSSREIRQQLGRDVLHSLSEGHARAELQHDLHLDDE